MESVLKKNDTVGNNKTTPGFLQRLRRNTIAFRALKRIGGQNER